MKRQSARLEINGQIKKLTETINGIAVNIVSDSAEIMGLMILGKSLSEIPVDTGHMRHNTGGEIDGQGAYSLYTNAEYAYSQYTNTLNHYWDGKYKSISRASVQFGQSESDSIEVLEKGKKYIEKRQFNYWTKFEILKSQGKLTKIRAEWFNKAANKVMDPFKVKMQKHFIDIARKQAQQGRYYKSIAA